jgi:hypothetical protein
MARSKQKLVLIVREFRNKKTGRVDTYSVQHCPSASVARKQLRRDAGLKGAGKARCVEHALIQLRKYSQFWIHTTASPRKFKFRETLGGHYTKPRRR